MAAVSGTSSEQRRKASSWQAARCSAVPAAQAAGAMSDARIVTSVKSLFLFMRPDPAEFWEASTTVELN
ncbi:hypothetical protein [Methylocystis bryophila]|uniref:hypothetical protein n=1 Tax=Methylocystis bryophila TaxID=655015 RepID=UPI001319D93F|nr:hypothetical protein [Methylocystis bryophila]BDV37498.1 hypothetical protein DSM21852_07510 [Methylocystis bryophila]